MDKEIMLLSTAKIKWGVKDKEKVIKIHVSNNLWLCSTRQQMQRIAIHYT